MEEDPYRSGTQVGTCPRCGATIESDGVMERLVCLAGCGEWYPRARLDTLLAWRSVEGAARDGIATGWPWGAAPCPICHREMVVSVRAELRFDHCDAHGVWLDAGEYDRFAEIFLGQGR